MLYVDGQEVAKKSMENSTPVTFAEDETFDIGQDTRTGVAMVEYRYDAPFSHRQDRHADLRLEPGQPAATQLEQVHEPIRKRAP